MKIAISTESTCDLSDDLINKYNIKVVPFTVILGDEFLPDGDGILEKIFNYVEKTGNLPKTSAVNENDYFNHFSNIMKEYDAIIHISLSSEISSAYSNAVKTASKFENVFVIDSRSLSTGIALLLIYAKKLIDKNIDIKEIVKKIENRIPSVQASFVLEKLNYLYKGGRCNALSFFGANLLKLRPQILLKDGSMKPAKKYRGKIEKVITDYCHDTLQEFSNPDKSVVFITHTTATPEMIENARKELQNFGFENIYETTAGGTITSHCGEHTLGILYINDGEQNL